MKENNFRLNHLFLGLCAGGVAALFIWYSPCISKESVFMLVIFDFLFVSLVFPLAGTLACKLLLLSMGTIVGWLWNYVFSMLQHIITNDLFATFYAVLSPFANLLWVVPFWSISLTFLANSKKEKEVAT
jgi:hypothetical protein